ncbi:hypothetical protein SLA2020_091260 [Shorea laevis]
MKKEKALWAKQLNIIDLSTFLIIESEENVCPYVSYHSVKHHVLGALAIKLSSVHASCGDYVVELLFKRPNMTLETQKQLVHRIIDYLKNATPRFVTYGNQGPLVELAEAS